MIRNGHWLDCRWMNVITLIWCPKFHVIAFFLLLFLSIISCSFARNLTASSAGGAGIQRSATAIKQLLLNWCKSKTQEYEVHAKPISLNQQHNDDGQIVYRRFMLYAYQWNGKSELQSYLGQSSLVTLAVASGRETRLRPECLHCFYGHAWCAVWKVDYFK